MSLSRYLPHTRETAEETKRRVWKDHGMLVVAVTDPRLDWLQRETAKQIGRKIYGCQPGNDSP